MNDSNQDIALLDYTAACLTMQPIVGFLRFYLSWDHYLAFADAV